jgi:iron complex transport system ATP-binding protein
MVVVVVLHDLSLASRFCDRLALLERGSVLATGTPREVLSERLLALGFGIAAVSGASDGEHFVVPWREVPT